MYPLLKEHITTFKYGLLVLNIILMIIAIKALVNHQTIVDSIDGVNYNIQKTQEHTAYINNFLIPYLQSDYAPYFAAHENNRLFPGEKIIKIVIPLTGDSIGSAMMTTQLQWASTQTPPQSWQRFILDLLQ